MCGDGGGTSLLWECVVVVLLGEIRVSSYEETSVTRYCICNKVQKL